MICESSEEGVGVQDEFTICNSVQVNTQVEIHRRFENGSQKGSVSTMCLGCSQIPVNEVTKEVIDKSAELLNLGQGLLLQNRSNSKTAHLPRSLPISC